MNAHRKNEAISGLCLIQRAATRKECKSVSSSEASDELASLKARLGFLLKDYGDETISTRKVRIILRFFLLSLF